MLTKEKKPVPAPDGFIRSKYLMIFLNLWLKKVCAPAFELHGLSVKSIVKWSFYKDDWTISHAEIVLKFLKEDGRLSRNSSLYGHTV